MSQFTVIADIGLSLIKLLGDNMQDLNLKGNSLVLCSPAEVTDEVSLSLFLYQVAENPHLRNQQPREANPNQQGFSPLYLDLHYLLTTYSKAEVSGRSLEEHRILGKAMSIFHDNAVLRGPTLQGGLAGHNEEFRISLNNLSLEDSHRLWSTFPNAQFRPSVSYLVTPVSLDSTRLKESGRVITRELKYNLIGRVDNGD